MGRDDLRLEALAKTSGLKYRVENFINVPNMMKKLISICFPIYTIIGGNIANVVGKISSRNIGGGQNRFSNNSCNC